MSTSAQPGGAAPLGLRHRRRPKTRRPIGATADGIIPFSARADATNMDSSPPHLYLLYRASKATQVKPDDVTGQLILAHDPTVPSAVSNLLPFVLLAPSPP